MPPECHFRGAEGAGAEVRAYLEALPASARAAPMRLLRAEVLLDWTALKVRTPKHACARALLFMLVLLVVTLVSHMHCSAERYGMPGECVGHRASLCAHMHILPQNRMYRVYRLLPCKVYEDIDPSFECVDMPYSDAADDAVWRKTLVLSWRRQAPPKPAERTPKYTPMTPRQLEELQVHWWCRRGPVRRGGGMRTHICTCMCL